MANLPISETKTENLFRKQYGAMTFIEKSAIPAKYGFKSKKGTDYKGYPDFFKEEEDFCIVVEAKAENHSLAQQEVQWYMNKNQISKDIIGIAVSGQTKRKLKYTYYIKQNDQKKIELFFESDCPQVIKQINIQYKKIKYGDAISTEELISTLNSLNKKFNKDNIIRDTDRSLFFSGLMIALKNNNFRNTYASIEKPEIFPKKVPLLEAHNLNNAILTAITTELEGKINNKSKEYNWRDKFSFIKTVDFSLDEYKKIIDTIKNKIFMPFQNEEKYDILGRAYKIFLSRAGKVDNKNIILTPDHIKELMVDLARLNTNDVVLDTCTGSGGFLMQAMEVLLKLVKGDKKSEHKIKEKQLIGFEVDPVLFALACSNMFLHGDGRTNLIYRSSLLDLDKKEDKSLFKYIKSKKATKIIINPPYENNAPIQFVKQAIDFLETNGKLIIIMPTPSLRRNQDGMTEEILKIAKLDFVIKMPNKLFSEQKRSVNTSIFGFTKTPHNKNDEVLFYNLDDDGFVSVQHKGRIDKNNTWNTTKQKILDSIFNSKECVEVCEKRKLYKDNILNCSGVRKKKISEFEMVHISQLFEIEEGTLASEKSEDGDYPFITASEEWKTHSEYTHDCEAIVYAVKAAGSLGRTHYINGKFVASNLCLILKNKNNPEYKVDMQFYNYYFTSVRKQIISDLADGTSKLTIDKTDLEQYYIDYIPYEKQRDFVETKIKKFENLKRKFLRAKKQFEAELYKM